MKKSYIQPQLHIEKIDICYDLLVNSPDPTPDPTIEGNHEPFEKEEDKVNW